MAQTTHAPYGGMTYEDIYAEQRRRLHTAEEARRLLASTEPLNTATFGPGSGVRFRLGNAWNHDIDIIPDGTLIDAYVTNEGSEHQLTKGALLEATSLIGLSKGYAMRCPQKLVEPQINYWFDEGFDESKRFKMLLVGEEQQAQGLCRGSIIPFSNLEIFDRAVAAIKGRYGDDTEILTDYKLTHNLAESYYRFIIPDAAHVMQDTGTDHDFWCAGIQVRNSLTGSLQTELSGYLFRWWCTNGAIDTYGNNGTWNRRGGQGDEVYAWAQNAVDEILGGFEHSFAAVQDLTGQAVSEDDLSDTLRTVFETFRIPGPLRRQVIENASNDDNPTMYSLMQAISQVANDPAIGSGHQDALMRTAGEFSRAAHHRCPSCHHLSIH